MLVIDEVHTALTSQTFRPIMGLLSTVFTSGVPVTYLTATLPRRLEPNLRAWIGIPEDHTMIRATTNRKEHQYSVFSVDASRLVTATAAFVTEASKAFLEGPQRGIVFVRTKESGRAMQKLFTRVDFVSGDVTDDSQRAEMILNWKTGASGRWIFGTTSITQGIDYHDVHLVVFMDTTWGMIDFVQGAGRAGRNGLPSKIVLLHTGWIPFPQNVGDLGCANEMGSWLKNTTECRRAGISMCMDSIRVTCESLEGAVPCDVCEPDPELKRVFKAAIDSEGEPTAPANHTTAPPSSPSAQPPTKLNVPNLRPQPSRLVVLKATADSLNCAAARRRNADECLSTMNALEIDCAICHALKPKVEYDHNMCFRKDRVGRELNHFYDHNKPQKVREG
jgi:hypothetical protein